MSAGSSVQSLRALARWVWFIVEMLSCDLHTGFNKKKIKGKKIYSSPFNMVINNDRHPRMKTSFETCQHREGKKRTLSMWVSPSPSMSSVLNFSYYNLFNLMKHTHLDLKLTRNTTQGLHNHIKCVSSHRNELINYLFAPAATPSVFSVTWKQQKAECW